VLVTNSGIVKRPLPTSQVKQFHCKTQKTGTEVETIQQNYS